MQYPRFDLRARRIQIVVFRVTTLCSDVIRYQRFGSPCRLHLQDESLVSYYITYTVSQPRKPRLETANILGNKKRKSDKKMN